MNEAKMKLKDPEFVHDWIVQETQKFAKENIEKIDPNFGHKVDILIEYSKMFQRVIENLLSDKRFLENSFYTLTGESPVDVILELKTMIEDGLLNDENGNVCVFPLVEIRKRLEEYTELQNLH